MTGTQEELQTIDRNNLIEELNTYTPTTQEKDLIPRFLNLLTAERCFYRDYFTPGHITGSAIILNTKKDMILMNYHKSLNKWMNFGGHCDGDEDVLNVAIRETMEESGLNAFKPLTASIIDIDIHTIPANVKKGEPAHEHFDIRYIMHMTGDQQPVISDESLDLKWMNFEDAARYIDDNDSLHRVLEKAKLMVA